LGSPTPFILAKRNNIIAAELSRFLITSSRDIALHDWGVQMHMKQDTDEYVELLEEIASDGDNSYDKYSDEITAAMMSDPLVFSADTIVHSLNRFSTRFNILYPLHWIKAARDPLVGSHCSSFDPLQNDDLIYIRENVQCDN
jgi:hypothetical protein